MPNRPSKTACRTFAFSVAFLLTTSLSAQTTKAATGDDVSAFYKGKTVRLIVGYTAGGGYDDYARVLAKYIGKYVPGHPTVIVENMTGAGSMRATNYIYSGAPADGTVIGTVGRGQAMEPLLGSTAAHYDAKKFTWLGSVSNELSVCALLTANNPKITNMADAEKYPSTVAGGGGGSDEDIFTNMLDKVLGLKMKLVTGYPGGREMTLAIERGEVDGRCGWSYTSLITERPQWSIQNKLTILAAMSMQRSPILPNSPSILEFAKTPRDKEIFRLIVSRQVLGRPFLAPPAIPADRAVALRNAFDRTMQDPEFVAEMKKSKLDLNPVSGQDIDKLLVDVYATPKDVVDVTKAIVDAP